MARSILLRRTGALASAGLFVILALVIPPGLSNLPALGDDLILVEDVTTGSGPDMRRFAFHVQNSAGKPVAGAIVTPWAVLCKGGSFLVQEKYFPLTKSDAEGNVTVVFPEDADLADDKELSARLLRDGLKHGLNRIALRVDHPEHPVYSEYLDVSGPRRVELVDSTTITIRINPGDHPRKIGTLYPVLSESFWYASNFSTKEGVLTIKRVDRKSAQASRWLRVVEIPEEGQAWFSDLIDLDSRPGNPINLEVEMKLGARLVGRLAGDVPRPVKNGRVVGQIIAGQNAWDGWSWGVESEIGPDGKFTIDSLPPDENLQLIALCDGWVSTSPSVDEVTAYGQEHAFEIQNPTISLGHVQPRLLRLTSGTIVRGIPMQATSSCEVTVLDPDGKPAPGATVSFWPNQFWYRGGAQVAGTGFDSLSFIREEIATGARPDPTRLLNRNERFSANTDDRGLALITNLPAGGDPDSVEERAYDFYVHDDRFESAKPALGAKSESVKIVPGRLGQATVRLKRN